MTEHEALAEILRKALLDGQSVEIDGLGIFQPSPGGYEFLPQLRPEVFVAYAAEDLAQPAASAPPCAPEDARPGSIKIASCPARTGPTPSKEPSKPTSS